jgi:hypothetical protein
MGILTGITGIYVLGLLLAASLAACNFEEDGLENTCELVPTSTGHYWPYCIHKTPGSTNPDIIYYMHGASGSERRWIERWPTIRDIWARAGVQAPTVVTFSAGPVWILSEKNSMATSGLLSVVADEFIPYVENKLGGLKGNRLLFGESMGGFNAIQLLMKRTHLWDRAAILCPAITKHSPFASVEVVEEFIKRTGAEKSKAYSEIAMFRSFFPDEQEWEKSAPLIAGKALLGAQTPPLYMSGDTFDQFGFYEGDVAFKDLVVSKNIPLEWHTIVGNHCKTDDISVSRFLVPGDNYPARTLPPAYRFPMVGGAPF